MPPELLELAQQRLDSAETIFGPRELIDLEAEILQTPHEPMMADILVPLDTGVNPGASSWAYRRMDAVGQARPIGTKAGDMPYVEIAEFETIVPMFELGLGFYYSVNELRAWRMAGKSAEADRGVACRDNHYARRDEIVMRGLPSLGIPGFISTVGVPVGNVTNGSWASASDDNIIADITNEIQSVKDTTRGVYIPSTIVLPPSAWNILTRRRLSNTETTIAEYVKRIRPGLEFFESYHLETAGVGGTRRMITYLRDRKVVVQKTSILFETLAPQPKDQLVMIPGLSKVGGTHWKVPIAGKYGDGL
jgi:hypothetical protein